MNRKGDRPAQPLAPKSGAGLLAGPLAGVIIGAAVILAYANSLSVPFLFDDPPAITLNESIRQLWPPGPALHPPTANGSGVAGRPIVNLTLAVNYAISGLDPWSYHAFNLAVHVLAALTLLGLVRRAAAGPALRDRLGEHGPALAFFASLLWALHPLQTESVTCVIQRTESLVGLFYLLTLYCFSRFNDSVRTGPQAAWALAAITACALGMGTKEVMVTAPLMALLYDRTFLSGSFRMAGRNRLVHGGLFATWAVLFWLLQGNPMRGGTADFGQASAWQYLLTQCRAIGIYLKLTLWPHPLVLDYGRVLHSRLTEVLPQALLLVGLFAATCHALWKRPVLGFLGAWFFVILAPSSSVIPLVTQTIAEHRMYLPLAALVVLGTAGLYLRLPRLAGPLCLVLATLCAGLTVARNQVLRDPAAVWTANLAHFPENPRPHVGLAEVADQRGDFADAALHYADYLAVVPENTSVRFNYAKDLVKSGRIPEAATEFERVLRERPADLDVRNNYGSCLARLQRLDEAAREFGLILRVDPRQRDAHFNLAEVLVKASQPADAVAHYRAALGAGEQDGFTHYRLADALQRLGRFAEAVAAYRDAVRLQPDNFAAWVNLGGACLQLRQVDQAIQAYESALRLKPGDPQCRQNLAYARSLQSR